MRGRGQVPTRSHRGSRRPVVRSLGPRALGRQSFSALSGSEDRCNHLCPEAETTADRVRSQSEDCRAATVASTLRCRMVFGPLARPEDRTVTPPPDAPRRESDDSVAAAAPESASTPTLAASPTRRWSRRPPRSLRTVLRPHVQNPGFESATLRAVPDSRGNRAPHDDWAARRRSHSRRNASLRTTRVPPGTACDSSRATRRQIAWSGRTSRARRGFRLPQGNPWGPAQARQTLHPCGKRDGTRSPHGPEGRVPTWIRRVRGRTA